MTLINESAVRSGERLVCRRMRIEANDAQSFVSESVSEDASVDL